MLSKAEPEKPRLQLVAAVTAEALEKFSKEIAKADAIILDITKADDVSALEKTAQIKDGRRPAVI